MASCLMPFHRWMFIRWVTFSWPFSRSRRPSVEKRRPALGTEKRHERYLRDLRWFLLFLLVMFHDVDHGKRAGSPQTGSLREKKKGRPKPRSNFLLKSTYSHMYVNVHLPWGPETVKPQAKQKGSSSRKNRNIEQKTMEHDTTLPHRRGDHHTLEKRS